MSCPPEMSRAERRPPATPPCRSISTRLRRRCSTWATRTSPYSLSMVRAAGWTGPVCRDGADRGGDNASVPASPGPPAPRCPPLSPCRRVPRPLQRKGVQRVLGAVCCQFLGPQREGPCCPVRCVGICSAAAGAGYAAALAAVRPAKLKAALPRAAAPQIRIIDADNGGEAINCDFMTYSNISVEVTAPRCVLGGGGWGGRGVPWRRTCAGRRAGMARSSLSAAVATLRCKAPVCRARLHPPSPHRLSSAPTYIRGGKNIAYKNGHHGFWAAASSNVLFTRCVGSGSPQPQSPRRQLASCIPHPAALLLCEQAQSPCI